MPSLDGGGKDKHSVRSYYCSLVCAFFSHCDAAITTRALAIKSLALPVFHGPGCFQHDSPETMSAVVSALHRGVSRSCYMWCMMRWWAVLLAAVNDVNMVVD
jgi:hypothetical protein